MSAGFQHPFLSSPRSSERGKVVTAREAVRLIRPGDTVATGGFCRHWFCRGNSDRTRSALPRGERVDRRFPARPDACTTPEGKATASPRA